MGSRPNVMLSDKLKQENRSVYFELRNFPLNRDKGGAYWRTEESLKKRGKSFRREKIVDGYMGYPLGSVYEHTPAGRSGTRYLLPEVCGPAQGASNRGKLSPTHRAHTSESISVRKADRARPLLRQALNESRYVRLAGGVSLDPGAEPPEGATRVPSWHDYWSDQRFIVGENSPGWLRWHLTLITRSLTRRQ
jgi:hypothetical protein